METTIVYWGLFWDNGKSNGNYYSILGVYRDNGKENGSYHSIMGCEDLAFRVGAAEMWSTQRCKFVEFCQPCSK